MARREDGSVRLPRLDFSRLAGLPAPSPPPAVVRPASFASSPAPPDCFSSARAPGLKGVGGIRVFDRQGSRGSDSSVSTATPSSASLSPVSASSPTDEPWSARLSSVGGRLGPPIPAPPLTERARGARQRRCRQLSHLLPWDSDQVVSEQQERCHFRDQASSPRKVWSSQSTGSSQSRHSSESRGTVNYLVPLPPVRSCLKNGRSCSERPRRSREVSFAPQERTEIAISRPPSAAADEGEGSLLADGARHMLSELNVLRAGLLITAGAKTRHASRRCAADFARSHGPSNAATENDCSEDDEVVLRPFGRRDEGVENDPSLANGLVDWSVVRPPSCIEPPSACLGRTWRGPRRRRPQPRLRAASAAA
mmetsp:Transcript_45281/g.145125  ORF Transcript_45281/g.145125 Transcript_45281/m.145125 type:complete len:366 (-) Transcript_45281:152-1249(-)